MAEKDKNRKQDIVEAIWFALMACIGVLFLIFLYIAGGIMTVYSETGVPGISGMFWLLAALLIMLGGGVLVLLRKVTPIEFRVMAMMLTGLLPIVATILIVMNVFGLGS